MVSACVSFGALMVGWQHDSWLVKISIQYFPEVMFMNVKEKKPFIKEQTHLHLESGH